MDTLVHDAHTELDEEVRRLGVAYQREILDAEHRYQQGLQAAQEKFSLALSAAAKTMVAELAEAFKR